MTTNFNATRYRKQHYDAIKQGKSTVEALARKIKKYESSGNSGLINRALALKTVLEVF